MKRLILVGAFVVTMAFQAIGDNPKIRGKIQEYERARAALVVYPKNRESKAKSAIRSAGFRVQEQLRQQRAFRVQWSGNSRAKLERMLDELSESSDIQVISPDSIR